MKKELDRRSHGSDSSSNFPNASNLYFPAIEHGERLEKKIGIINRDVKSLTCRKFSNRLVELLAEHTGMSYAFLGKFIDDGAICRVQSFWQVNALLDDDFIYSLQGTPCEQVIRSGETLEFPEGTMIDFPNDTTLAEMGIESYVGSPLFNAKGVPIGILGLMDTRPAPKLTTVNHLLTVFAARAGVELERTEYEEKLIAAKEQVERASQAKSDFMTHMSHDMRAPLNTIIGFSQLISRAGQNQDSAQNQANVIFRAGKYLAKLLDDMLDISKIEAGHLDVSLEPVDLKSVAMQSCNYVRDLAAKHHVTVCNELREDTLWVKADKTRLLQVLTNLLSNAVKYNRCGGTVRLYLEGHADNTLNIAVLDTGYGIPAEKLSCLFEPFNRLGFEHSKIEGTGIGLTITQALVEKMGAKLEVSSVVDEGTLFSFKLPSCAGDELLHKKDGEAGIEKYAYTDNAALGVQKSILIAEDDDINAELLSLQLELLGFSVDTASNGIEALQLYERNNYDIVLTDCNMPDMNGYELTKRIRQAEHGNGQHLPIVGVSGSAMEEDIRNSIRSGMDDCIAKPIALETLNATLTQFTSQSAGFISER